MRHQETLGLSRALAITKHEMRKTMDHLLAPLELSSAQYSVLSALEEKAEQTNADLARTSYVTPQTMFRMLSSLEERGFVQSADSADHGLKILFSLTLKAQRALCRAHQIVNDLEHRMTQGLKPREIDRFIEILQLCHSALEARSTSGE